MSALPDAHLDYPLLNDAFDIPFEQWNAKSLTDDSVRGRALFRRCPACKSSVHRKSKNVSEPQLVSSSNNMGGSWLTNFPTACTVDNIVSLSYEDESLPSIRSSENLAVTFDTSSFRSLNYDNLRGMPGPAREDSYDVFGSIESYKSEGSLYSTDSADQEAHPLLLSMPIIPQIKLERKATVRKPHPGPFPNAVQNQMFLSPRIPDLRTPARMSSRRYGRILSAASAPAVLPGVPHAQNDSIITFQTPRRSGSMNRASLTESATAERTCQRSASAPMLSFPSLDGEDEPILKRIEESPHSDLLLSIIDETNASMVPHDCGVESDTCEALGPEQVPPKLARRSHQRSSVSHSISFNAILHAVVDGCASLDHLIRRPKAKCKPITTEPKLTPNAHDTTSKWASKEGQIFVKVFVPSTDDIWMFRVSQDINLVDFTSRVVAKLGFVVSFSGSVWDEPKYYFKTDEQFKSWVKGRIRFGRNLPIVAHVLARLPLVRFSVDADGCEVWCYA